MDNLLLGMSSQIAEQEDNIVVEDLQGLYCSCALAGDPPCLNLCWEQGGEAGPTASSISTQPHASAPFQWRCRELQDTSSMSPHRLLVWAPEVLPY